MTELLMLCRLEDIPDHGARVARIDSPTGGFEVVLLRQGSLVFAYHNECPHAGRALDYVPGKFLVKDGRITCAAHGATFVVANGNCHAGPCRSGLVAVPVEILDGAVWTVRATH
ncbi:MAG: Rieske (2Fe-2S) protein [Dokdonella sp.]